MATINDQVIKLLAAKMLRLAQNTFSNHGCNDLDDEVIALIPQSLCDEIRRWNGGDEWPERAEQIGDSSLMAFLADALESEVEDARQ